MARSQRPPRPGHPQQRTVDRAKRTPTQPNAEREHGANAEREHGAEDGSLLSELLTESPSWLTSMLVHMILLLVLALVTFHGEIVDNIGELVVRPPIEDLPDDPDPDPPELKVTPTIPPTPNVPPEPPPAPPAVAHVEPVIGVEPLVDPVVDGINAEIREELFGGVLIGKLGPGGDSIGDRLSRKRIGPNVSESDLSAVEAALKWLAKHQNRDGSWSFAHTPGDRCSGFPDPGEKTSRMGATGIALLPFLGAGYTHHLKSNYQQTVKKGLAYLVKNRDESGRLYEANGESHSHMYCHGIAACALAEAYGMTLDSWLRTPSQHAVDYIVAAQHPQSGGWLYEPRQGGDTSVAGWQIMALKSAALSKLKIPPSVKPLAIRWLDSVQSERAPGGYGIGSQYGYRAAGDRELASACTAIGLLCRNYLGTAQDDPGLRLGVRSVSKKGPSISGRNADMYYNYYGAMLMYQNDGPSGAMWNAWNAKLSQFLKDSQVKVDPEAGSWHFTGNHGAAGGRVYSTAIAAMTLEVWYRYLPIYQQDNVQDDSFPIE